VPALGAPTTAPPLASTVGALVSLPPHGQISPGLSAYAGRLPASDTAKEIVLTNGTAMALGFASATAAIGQTVNFDASAGSLQLAGAALNTIKSHIVMPLTVVGAISNQFMPGGVAGGLVGYELADSHWNSLAKVNSWKGGEFASITLLADAGSNVDSLRDRVESLGFQALATTSAGYAFTRGLPDAVDALSLEDVLVHQAEIAAAAQVPVNADFQSGYADSPEGVAANVRRCVATGVAGLSIEDATPAGGLYEVGEAVARVRAAREAIDETGTGVLLTARAEGFLYGVPDPLTQAIERLTAFSEAGADVLFAPGVREPGDIRAIVEAVAPKPVNVLMSTDTGLTLEDLAQLGVRRVSVGSALARVGWGAFLSAARRIAAEGSFAGLGGAAPFPELNELFSRS